MAKSRKKPLTPNQQEWKRLQRRYSENVRRASKRGYKFNGLPKVSRPARITEKQLSEFRRLATGGYYEYSTVVDYSTGEVLRSGTEERQRRRIEGGKKAAQKRKFNQDLQKYQLPNDALDKDVIFSKIEHGQPLTAQQQIWYEGWKNAEKQFQEAISQRGEEPAGSPEPPEEGPEGFIEPQAEKIPDEWKPKEPSPEDLAEIRENANSQAGGETAPGGEPVATSLVGIIEGLIDQIPDQKWYGRGKDESYAGKKHELKADFLDLVGRWERKGRLGEYLEYLRQHFEGIQDACEGMVYDSGSPATDGARIAQLFTILKGEALTLEESTMYTDMGQNYEGNDAQK